MQIHSPVLSAAKYTSFPTRERWKIGFCLSPYGLIMTPFPSLQERTKSMYMGKGIFSCKIKVKIGVNAHIE
jgi:hypothetical protein